MIDLHTHTFFSDGLLIPSELVWQAKVKGYKAIAITDHVDSSNIDFIIPRMIKVCTQLRSEYEIEVLTGVELTYVPPSLISVLTRQARILGAEIVIVHGETTVEPVPPGTNRAGLLSNIDILAHPGKITAEDIELAVKNNVLLEISSRRGHCLTNSHVAALAKKLQAKLVINTDAHAPEDLISDEQALKIVKEAGLKKNDLEIMWNNAKELIYHNKKNKKGK
ncbi:histidinol phosphate phosphatase domain-containing protein [bacterium]|nr:histidinol phosphate phosphatase domain-containing protein [bacterium]